MTSACPLILKREVHHLFLYFSLIWEECCCWTPDDDGTHPPNPSMIRLVSVLEDDDDGSDDSTWLDGDHGAKQFVADPDSIALPKNSAHFVDRLPPFAWKTPGSIVQGSFRVGSLGGSMRSSHSMGRTRVLVQRWHHGVPEDWIEEQIMMMRQTGQWRCVRHTSWHGKGRACPVENRDA